MSEDYRLGGFLVRPQRGIIEQGDRVIRIKPKAMAVLQCLVNARGQVVSRDELFDAVWGKAVVSDATLSQCVVELRSAFGDSARESAIIETVPKVGFRIVPEVTPLPGESEEPEARQNPRRTIRPAVALLLLIGVTAIAGMFLYNRSSDRGDSELAYGTKTLAVLPFVDMSPERDQQHLADGITEELIHGLSQHGQLSVTGRTSSFLFKDRSEDLREVGKTLDVDHIVEGSVRKSADTLRITANLVDVESGTSLWSRVHERDTGDYFELQEEIADEVVAAMAIEAGLNKPGHIYGTSSFEAYEHVMKVYAGKHNPSREASLMGLEHLQMATEIDPGYAYAWAAMANMYVVLQDNLSPDWREISGRHLARALELDDESPQVLEYTVYWHVAAEQWAEAERVLAGMDDPLNLSQLAGRLELLIKVGRVKEALEIGERLNRRDPLGARTKIYLQHLYAILGRTDDALAQSEVLFERLPGPVNAQEALLTAFTHDDPAVLRLWLDRLLPFVGESTVVPTMAEHLDNPQFALDWLRQADIVTPQDQYAAPAWAAHLGDPELALQMMQDDPDPWAFWMPHNAGVRRLDGFRELVTDLGLVDYWREFGWGDFCRPLGEEDFECGDLRD